MAAKRRIALSINLSYMGSSEELLGRIQSLNVWRRGDERAPHKPLLLLMALGRLDRGQPRLTRFTVLADPLAQLLREFGPPRRAVHPEYPFWRLQSDGLWEVPGGDALKKRASNSDPLKSELMAHSSGGLPEEVHQLLVGNRVLVRRVARELLDAHFPASYHDELLAAVGLHTDVVAERPSRDPRFRQQVLEAYGQACAVCGFDGRLGAATFGLDAAHIRWKQAHGPDEVPNGLALCALHHRALDRGAIGLTEGRRLLVSAKVAGSKEVQNALVRFQGEPLREPHAEALAPDPMHIAWHRSEVFRSPARGEPS